MHDRKVHDCNKSAQLSLHNQGLILALITLHKKTFEIAATLLEILPYIISPFELYIYSPQITFSLIHQASILLEV